MFWLQSTEVLWDDDRHNVFLVHRPPKDKDDLKEIDEWCVWVLVSDQ